MNIILQKNEKNFIFYHIIHLFVEHNYQPMTKFIICAFFIALNLKAQTNLPDVTLSNLEGKKISLTKDFSEQDKLYVLSFWATWCTPCVEEMPLLEAFFQENQSKSWQVVGLAIDQPSAVKRFLKQNPVNYPIGFAGLGGTELVKTLGNPEGGLPFTLVLNAQGGLIVQKLGKLSSQEMREWV